MASRLSAKAGSRLLIRDCNTVICCAPKFPRLSASGVEQFPADQHAADLRCAGADFVQLGVLEQAAGVRFVGIAITSQCLGGNGYINDYPTGRLLRDAKLYEIGAGTSEIRRMLIGRELFKETA